VLESMEPVDRIKNMVRHALIATPGVTNRELLSRAREIAPEAVEGLSLQQFHGKYRLPIMRYEMSEESRARIREASAKSRRTRKSKRTRSSTAGPAAKKNRKQRTSRRAISASTAFRSAVRAVLVDFAVTLEKAESRADLVQAMARLDAHVDRIVNLVDSPAEASPADGVAPESNGRPER
jgi:hypothetical protein